MLLSTIREKKIYLLVLISYFLLIIFTFILTHHTFLGVQDEAHLHATLMGNEPINYMTSYPLAKLFGYLYIHFPTVQWYSMMMTGYILFMLIIMSFYMVSIQTDNKIVTWIYRILLLIFFTLLLVYMLLEVDVTSPTLLLIVLAIPLIRKHQIYFWFLVWIASFLREQMLVSVLPLILLAYSMHVSKAYFTKKKIAIILLFILGILFNHFSYKIDKTYDEWMDFTEKRAYYTDFGGIYTKGLLSSDEYHLSKTWWITDLDLYPYQKVAKAAGSTIDILKERFLKENPSRNIKGIFLKHPYLYTLILLSLMTALLYKSTLRFLAYTAFFVGFILLLMVKDVERVTLPLMLLWWSILASDFWYYKKSYPTFIRSVIGLILLWCIYYIAETLPLDRITHYAQKEALVKEFKGLLHKHPMELEITSGYPASWERLIEVIMQNHLFDEAHWVDYHDDLLLSGWLTRVPLVYKQHHISFNGVKRTYAHYHDWMLADHTGIIGSKGESKHIRPFLRDKLMKLYDQKFPKEGCQHKPIIVDQTEHFIIHRIIQQCNPIQQLTKNISLLNKNKIWDFSSYFASTHHGMTLENHTLNVTNNDPWILVGIPKVVHGDILFHIEITSSVKTIMQLFYRKQKAQNFTELHSYKIPLYQGKNSILLRLPAQYLNHTLRLDPVTKKGSYTIGDIAIYTAKNTMTQK